MYHLIYRCDKNRKNEISRTGRTFSTSTRSRVDSSRQYHAQALRATLRSAQSLTSSKSRSPDCERLSLQAVSVPFRVNMFDNEPFLVLHERNKRTSNVRRARRPYTLATGRWRVFDMLNFIVALQQRYDSENWIREQHWIIGPTSVTPRHGQILGSKRWMGGGRLWECCYAVDPCRLFSPEDEMCSLRKASRMRKNSGLFWNSTKQCCKCTLEWQNWGLQYICRAKHVRRQDRGAIQLSAIALAELSIQTRQRQQKTCFPERGTSDLCFFLTLPTCPLNRVKAHAALQDGNCYSAWTDSRSCLQIIRWILEGSSSHANIFRWKFLRWMYSSFKSAELWFDGRKKFAVENLSKKRWQEIRGDSATAGQKNHFFERLLQKHATQSQTRNQSAWAITTWQFVISISNLMVVINIHEDYVQVQQI